MERDSISVAKPFLAAVARAGRSQERETGGSASRARSGPCRQRPVAEPWPKRQERKNGSTSVEKTGHLLVRALRAQLCQPPFEEGSV